MLPFFVTVMFPMLFVVHANAVCCWRNYYCRSLRHKKLSVVSYVNNSNDFQLCCLYVFCTMHADSKHTWYLA